MFLRHDLMRVSVMRPTRPILGEPPRIGSHGGCYAARLIAAERWDELIGFIDMVERDRPNQYTVMFPEDLVAYEWESLREAAFEALGRWDELRAMYRERIVEAYDPPTCTPSPSCARSAAGIGPGRCGASSRRTMTDPDATPAIRFTSGCSSTSG